MSKLMCDRRMAWLVVGLVCGLGLAYFWPHEPSWAASTDRNDKFALTTVRVDGSTEAIFVIDFLTGRLQGRVYNSQAGMFVATYYRNLADDFKVNPDTEPQYAIIPGLGSMQSRGRAQVADSSLYVAELSSGKVAMYAIPYQTWNRPVPAPIELVPVTAFSFRERLKLK